MRDYLDELVHLRHCNFGENLGHCKYGEEECPAITTWGWLPMAYIENKNYYITQSAVSPEERANKLALDQIVDIIDAYKAMNLGSWDAMKRLRAALPKDE